MSTAFDQRILQVTIQFEDGAKVYDGLSIYACGQKFAAALFTQCEIRIVNLTQDDRNYILSRTSPMLLKKMPVRIFIDIGRESYGTFRLFDGYVKTGGVTQPPDISIILVALANSFLVSRITSITQSSLTQLSTISKSIADANELILDFQATDKQIENFAYNGAVAYQLRDLNAIGGILAFIDNNTLVVLNAGTPKAGEVRQINASTGMVGIPQFTEKGIIVKVMIQNEVKLMEKVHIESKIIPAANGDYLVQKILFDVASRDQAFFYVLDCILPIYALGTQ